MIDDDDNVIIKNGVKMLWKLKFVYLFDSFVDKYSFTSMFMRTIERVKVRVRISKEHFDPCKVSMQ